MPPRSNRDIEPCIQRRTEHSITHQHGQEEQPMVPYSALENIQYDQRNVASPTVTQPSVPRLPAQRRGNKLYFWTTQPCVTRRTTGENIIEGSVMSENNDKTFVFRSFQRENDAMLCSHHRFWRLNHIKYTNLALSQKLAIPHPPITQMKKNRVSKF